MSRSDFPQGTNPQPGPLLSDRDVSAMREDYRFLFSGHEELNSEAWTIGALDIRKRYEAKITSGELRVVKKVKNSNSAPGWFSCSSCDATIGRSTYSYPPHESECSMGFNFCPGCGAQIVTV